MKELLKVIQFYKLRYESDKLALDYFFSLFNNDYYIKSTRMIKTDEFNFIFFPKKKTTYQVCPLCFENIYLNPNLKIMPILLNNRYYFIQPSIKQYVKNHLVIIDFTHKKMAIDNTIIISFYQFLKLFPSLVICSNCELEGIGGSILNHQHFQAGCIDSQLFKRDAELMDNEIYEVDWYLETYLIKNVDINIVNEKYLYLLEKCQNEATSFNPVMFIRDDVIYLYLIKRCKEEINIHKEYTSFKEGVGVFEVLGNFILNEQQTPVNELIENAKNILTYKRK